MLQKVKGIILRIIGKKILNSWKSISQNSIDTDTPSNLNEAIDYIFNQLSPQEIEKAKERQAWEYHSWFGMGVRNELKLWHKDTPLVQWFIDNLGICHADDISGTILEGLFCKIKGKDFDPELHVKRYENHWYAYGINPKTMEKYE